MNALEMKDAAAPARVRRLLIAQALLLLVGWFAILACQAARESKTDPAPTIPTGSPRNAAPSALLEGMGVVAAVVAFAWAGRLRAQVRRSLPRSSADPARRRASEAA